MAVGRKTIAWQWEPWLAAPLFLFIYLFECSAPAPSRCWRQEKKGARPWRQEDFLPPPWTSQTQVEVPILTVSRSARVTGGRRVRRVRGESQQLAETRVGIFRGNTQFLKPNMKHLRLASLWLVHACVLGGLLMPVSFWFLLMYNVMHVVLGKSHFRHGGIFVRRRIISRSIYYCY